LIWGISKCSEKITGGIRNVWGTICCVLNKGLLKTTWYNIQENHARKKANTKESKKDLPEDK
jgi:hypothetical protein